MRRIELKSFTCKCGHISTAPDAVNSYAHQMDEVAIEPLEDVDVPARMEELKAKHPGNTFSTRTEGAFRVTRIARSYAKAEFDGDKITKADHIVLKCPECDGVLYDVRFNTVELRKQRIEEDKKNALATALEQIKAQGGDIDETQALLKAGLRKTIVNGQVKIIKV